MHAGKLWMKIVALCSILGMTCALAQTRASCEAYLATDPSPTGIPAVSGPGIAQRSELLAAGGKLVAIGTRYYSVSIPAAFYTAATPVLVPEIRKRKPRTPLDQSGWATVVESRTPV